MPTPLLHLYGPTNTGKSTLVRAIGTHLSAVGLRSNGVHRWICIDCRDFLTSRALYERILDDIEDVPVSTISGGHDADLESALLIDESAHTADSLDVFAHKLERLSALRDRKRHAFDRGILVLDHFSSRWVSDRAGLVAALRNAFQRGSAAATPIWSALFVSDEVADVPTTMSISVVFAPPYTAEDVSRIVQKSRTDLPLVVLHSEDESEDATKDNTPANETSVDDDVEAGQEMLTREETDAVYARFVKLLCSAYWDRLGPSCIPLYRRLARRLWPIYIQPVQSGRVGRTNHVQLGKIAGARGLWQNEAWLLEMSGIGHAKPDPGPVVGLNWSFTTDVGAAGTSPSINGATREGAAHGDVQRVVRESDALRVHDSQRRLRLGRHARDRTAELGTTARYLLIASYLASYNPTRLDRTLFSHGSGTDRDGLTKRGTPRKRRTAKPRGAAAASGTASQDRVSQRLLGPKGFVLERMLGIYHAILTTSESAAIARQGTASHTAQLDQQIATLASLRLLWKGNGSATEAGAGGGGGGGGRIDYLDEGRWTCAIGFDAALRLAQDLGFDLQRYLAD